MSSYQILIWTPPKYLLEWSICLLIFLFYSFTMRDKKKLFVKSDLDLYNYAVEN